MTGYTGVVEKVILNGRHGPYAIASVDQLGSVTFSLDKSVWQENDLPGEGFQVELSDIRKKRAGWRAMTGRFVRPSNSNQQPVVKSKE